jgi:phosphohistidine phosphatase
MKTLLLMRHAKSTWKHHDLEDHERPLNKRGKKDIILMGKLIQEKELLPQIILCSSAVRAHATAEGLTESSDYKGKITYLDSFYLAEPHAYIEELCKLPDNVERVMVIGHNPGIEGLVQILSGQVESLSTAAIAYLVMPIQKWSDLNGESRGELVELWRPRDLKEKSKK